VNAPLRWNDAIIGDIGLGTCSPERAVSLGERLPTVEEFAVMVASLLGPALAERDRAATLRRTIAGVLAVRAFHPVFQPIVELASGETVGYEALTRFDSRQRADLGFADAWSVGLGADLELATLEDAVAAARRLPAGLWLNLNVSPRLLADPERLREILCTADRPLVLEITEHEVIEDYAALRTAVGAVGHDIRLAVDDAGAGVANFGHIIELRPDFVKLDISLVRGVNADLGRQAMVAGMRHFARTAGCRLIAEGVETAEEARTLTGFGVELGQGYLLGRPEPVEVWAGVRAAA
jgi:EAL domain-containing protein (putative c-di-GMP-specific phosphodiesterase class I)